MNSPSESQPSASAGAGPSSCPHSVEGTGLRRRGRVLRDTAVGDGLVFVDGDTYPFQLERLWRSEIAPRVNMAVDVEFGPDARIMSIRAVPGTQLFGDQTAHALDAAQSAARKMASELNQRGAPALQQVIGRVGASKLVAVCALALGWYSMHLLVINLGGLGKLALTFHDVLKVLNSDILNGDFRTLLLGQSLNPLAAQSAGVYGLAAFVAVIAPLTTPFIRDRRFQLADAAPLLLLGIVAVIAYSQILSLIHATQSALGELGGGGTADAQQLGTQVKHGLASAVSVGLGAYVSVLCSVYLAITGYLRFRGGDAGK